MNESRKKIYFFNILIILGWLLEYPAPTWVQYNSRSPRAYMIHGRNSQLLEGTAMAQNRGQIWNQHS